MDYIEWAKQNKKTVAEKIIKDSAATSGKTPTAIIMAGIPGAGKTEFLNRLDIILNSSFVRIDLDKIVEEIIYYKPEQYYLYRGIATPILEVVIDKSLKYSLNFALDGTFAHKNSLDNINRALRHGFRVMLFYIYQDPIIAWNITKDRESVTKRGISIDGFLATCKNTPLNVRQAILIFGDNPMVQIIGVIKNDLNKYSIKEPLRNVDDITEKTYTSNELAKRIK